MKLLRGTIVVLLLVLVVGGCGPVVKDDGHLFLAPTPGHRLQSSPAGPTAVAVARRTPTISSSVRGLASTRVFFDPGHGGVDTGSLGTTVGGTVVEEKAIALAIAQHAAARLRADGIGVILSRTDDSLPGSIPTDYTPDGQALTPQGVFADLQRRIDRANASGAEVFVSIHLNGFPDPSVSGTQTLYDAARPFADQSLRVATLIQSALVRDLRSRGYDSTDRGITDDQDLEIDSLSSDNEEYHHLLLLGPAIPGRLRPSPMPGAVSEVLFLSNPADATTASQTDVQESVGVAIARAIEQFLDESA